MKLTQRQRVLNYMREFGSITPMEAFADLGVTKLATRISELINEDKVDNIVKIRMSTVNRFGEHCNYMKYSLKPTTEGFLSTEI